MWFRENIYKAQQIAAKRSRSNEEIATSLEVDAEATSWVVEHAALLLEAANRLRNG
jgi:hypothetical protein